ncbi:MAG: hypothetical protein EXS08_01125 [Planctomycetes bacterium]|nr:hypothetical protein [Planctomycetota bacterium]
MSVLAQGDVLLLGAAKAELSAAASALFVLALAARPWRARASPVRTWGAPLAVGLAAAVGFWMTRGAPAFPPAQALHWIFYAALVGAAGGALEGWNAKAARIVRALLSVLLPVLLLEFQRSRHWGQVEGMLWTAGLAGLLFGAWSALAAFERRPQNNAASTLGWALASALAAGAYLYSGGALFAQLVGAFSLALGLCALLGFWKRAPGLGPTGVAPYALLHFGFLWSARYLNELSTASFALLSVAPLLTLGARLVPSLRPRLATACALLGPTLPAALALYLEWSAARALGAEY